MLINYSVTNFLSFKDKATLSLEPGERLRKYPENKQNVNVKQKTKPTEVLKNAVLFGSNGSGKSNLLSSIDLMKKMISNIPPKITTPLPDSTFCLNDSANKQNIKFEIEIVKNQNQYKYMFEFNKDNIVNEKLSIFKRNKYQTYFERKNTTEFVKIPTSLKNYVKETRKNVLFLQTAQSKNDENCMNIIEWFDNDLVIFDREMPQKLLKILEIPENKDKLLKFIKLADLNIIDIEIENYDAKSSKEIPEEIQRFVTAMNDFFNQQNFQAEVSKEIRKNLYTKYKKYDSEGSVIGLEKIPINMDSSGTRKIIYLALHFLFCQNKVLLMDEFDDAFHEEISNALLHIFNSNNNGAQFILTSHELKLMDNKLRKDQIYFVQKDFMGESELYSIFDFVDIPKARNDSQFYNKYKSGSFGAKPIVDREGMEFLVNNGQSFDMQEEKNNG